MSRGASRPSEIFVEQMRAQRERRGWSQRQLAERLDTLGLRVHQTTVGKWESGERGLSLDEALAITAALDLAPVHMISGSYLEAQGRQPAVTLGGEMSAATAREMRQWVRGERPLRGQDERRFRTEIAPDEWQTMQRAGMRELIEDVRLLVAAWADADHGAIERILGAIGDELQRQRRALDRETHPRSASRA